MVKFLVIRFSSIGDIVLTTPLVRCLHEQVGDASIHYLTKEEYRPLLKCNPHIEKVHGLQKNLVDIARQLKDEQFDYIIDLHNNFRSAFVKSKLRNMSFGVNKINFAKWLMVNFKINRLPDVHLVDRYMETVKIFEVRNDGRGLDHYIPRGDEIEPRKLFPDLEGGYIILATGAKHATKRIPADKLTYICEHLHLPVILTGGKEDRRVAEAVAHAAGSRVFNACGTLNINQSASLVRQSALVITPDTGIMHLAAALKKNILSVWGNTIPGFGMKPYFPGEKSRIFEVKNLACRPCSKLGYDKCPRQHFKCMYEQDYDGLIRAAGEIAGS